ncbi:MAG TPA: hypothetical protein VM694_00375 [Polyangium sp.]|nr:hypothetical protein [Polyangium sp.]
MNRVGIACIVLGIAGCMPPEVPSYPRMGTPLEPTFSLLPSGSRDIVVPMRSGMSRAAGPGYRYIVHIERSDGGGPLHAVCIDGEHAYAAGAGGIVLRRSAHTGWKREESGTTHALRGFAVIPRSNGQQADSDATIFAVGDAGTILRRDAAGWHAEPSGTTRDLHAVQVVGGALLAVGDGGTILEREETGSWRSIAAHTDADLRAISIAGIAVGRAGAIVDCLRWALAERTSFACVPRPSPVDVDLWAFRGTFGEAVFGSGGLSLERETSPGPAVYKTSRRFETTLRSAATNSHEWTLEAGHDDVAVGDGGAIVIFPAGGDRSPRGDPATIRIPGSPTLDAVAFKELDGFAVGAGGVIVHLQIDGARVDYFAAPAA